MTCERCGNKAKTTKIKLSFYDEKRKQWWPIFHFGKHQKVCGSCLEDIKDFIERDPKMKGEQIR